LGKQNGFTPWQQSGYEGAKWIVLDCVNVVVHVFDGDSRDFYDLELLWGDAPRVDWRKELGLPPEMNVPQRPEEDEGPFLAEERDLIESLARALKGFLNRRKTEQALSESESLYHTLADAAHDMVYIIGMDGRFTYFNGYAEDLLGESPDEYVGKSSRDLYAAAIAGQHERYESEVMVSGEPAYFEELAEFRHRRLWTANWLVPIKGRDGKITSIMCVVRDIDGRKRAEETLLQAEKELERLNNRPGK
jgi:PAS domain S-box-containing protein